jgi:hypothetical protein
VGTTISTNVEISGRSSAHVNAYDALNAVSECTAPAAMQLGVGGGPGVDSPDLSLFSISDRSQRTPPLPQEDQHQQRGWEGLASFLFGQEWFSIHLGGEEDFNEKEEDVDADAKMNGSQTMAGATPGGDEDGKKVVSTNGNSDASSSAPPKKAISGGKTFLPNRPTLPSSLDENGDLTSTQPKAGKWKQLLTKMMKSDKTVTFSLDGQKSLGEDGKIIDLVASDENDGFSSSDDAAVGRWHAPYLHTVPAFPVVKNTKAIANPHRLAEKKITLSLHDYSTEMEACVDYSPKKRTKKGSVVVVDNRETKQNAVGLRDEMAERAMRAALRIPDDVYFTMGTVWGSVRMEDGSSKVKLQTTTPSADATSTSKEKLNSSPKPLLSSSNKNGVEEHDSSATVSMPPYVPNFLPPFPSDYSSGIKKHDSMITASMTAASSVMGNIVSRLHNRDKKRKSSSDNSLAVGEIVKPSVLSNRNALRRSVIDLGRSVGHSYWGSNIIDVDTIDDVRRCSTNEQSTNTNDIFSNTLSDMSVERGRASSSSAMEATAPSKKTDGLVAPLTRASGSRVRLFSTFYLFYITPMYYRIHDKHHSFCPQSTRMLCKAYKNFRGKYGLVIGREVMSHFW